MAYEVVLDPLVAERVDNITSYICDVLGSPSAAASFLNGFESLVAALERLPFSYPRPLDARLQARGYRKALIGKYVVLFRVDESGEGRGTVYITNLFHGTQNYRELV